MGETINNKLYLRGISRANAIGDQIRCNYIAFSGILQPKQQGDRMQLWRNRCFGWYLYVSFEHRTSKVGFASLSPFIKRQNALFDVGRSMLDVRIFLREMALPQTGPIMHAGIKKFFDGGRLKESDADNGEGGSIAAQVFYAP